MDKNKLQPIDGSDVSGVVTARGTGEGLIVRIDGRAEKSDIKRALSSFLEQRKRYLTGQEVTVEWIGKTPGEAFVEMISREVFAGFDITVRRSRTKQAVHLVETSEEEESADKKVVSFRSNTHKEVLSPQESIQGDALFGGVGSIFDGELSPQAPEYGGATVGDGALWDEADARMVYLTLRSGQRIETEHSVIVFGDVNSGAEIIAGGDIVVLGKLRGVAHAGAYDTTGGGRVIFALGLQPRHGYYSWRSSQSRWSRACSC
jgi:septum site-determining protein MinC